MENKIWHWFSESYNHITILNWKYEYMFCGSLIAIRCGWTHYRIIWIIDKIPRETVNYVLLNGIKWMLWILIIDRKSQWKEVQVFFLISFVYMSLWENFSGSSNCRRMNVYSYYRTITLPTDKTIIWRIILVLIRLWGSFLEGGARWKMRSAL